MKRLLILRHAKSDWSDPIRTDFERCLNARGRKAAPQIGKAMADRGWIPDAALVSSAQRTRETFQLVEKALASEISVSYKRDIYEATLPTLLGLLRKADAAHEGTVLLVGHNPGMQGLAACLAGAGDASLILSINSHYPTGALCVLTFPDGYRGEASGTLEAFLRPRDLEASS